MTSQQRLEELRQQAKNLAKQIEQLEDQINSAEPTTGLLGRWAKHPKHGDVLITNDRADNDGQVYVRYLVNEATTGVRGAFVPVDTLELPDQTTRPQDVPVGEAWLVDATDGHDQAQQTKALKVSDAWWITPNEQPGEEPQRLNSKVTLITPLIPARPQGEPETVTTEREYGDLLEGSVVAKPGEKPWTHLPYEWAQEGDTVTTAGLAGTTRHILRRGWWGE